MTPVLTFFIGVDHTGAVRLVFRELKAIGYAAFWGRC